MTAVGGVLLTGGTSRRMGTDKASIMDDGRSWAVRAADVLTEVCHLAVEVGPGQSGLALATEDHPGEGPLPAIVAGRLALRRAGHDGPVIVLACDLPRLTVAALRHLATWPGAGSVVPVNDGMPQVLCARWSATALEAAADRVTRGERRVRGLLEADDAVLIDESTWSAQFGAGVFADADTPADLARLTQARA